MESFLFGGNGGAPTYEALKRKRELADALMAQGARRPQNMWDGIASVSNALAGRYLDNKISPQEDAAKSELADIVAGLNSSSEFVTPAGRAQAADALGNPFIDDGQEMILREIMKRDVAPMVTASGRDMLYPQPEEPVPAPPPGWSNEGMIMDMAGLGGFASGAGGTVERPVVDGPQVAELDEAARAVVSDTDANVTQGQRLNWLHRMRGASETLDDPALAEALTARSDRLKDMVPGFGNALVSDDFRLARRAADDWLENMLRMSTGAVINASEFDRLNKIFVPQPGDTAADIAAKQEARTRAQTALEASLGDVVDVAAELERIANEGDQDPDWMINVDPSEWTPEQVKEAKRRWGME